MSIDISVVCDECKNGISDGEYVYCEDCWKNKEKELENQISEKDREIESFERDVSELEEKIRENDVLIHSLNVRISELEMGIG